MGENITSMQSLQTLFTANYCFEKISECKSKRVPIIGIGGVSSWHDVIEYIMAGATAVGVGTAWFVNPNIFAELKKGIGNYLQQQNMTIDELVGKAHVR